MNLSCVRCLVILFLCLLLSTCREGEITLQMQPPDSSRYSMEFSTRGKIQLQFGGEELGTDMNMKIMSVLQVDTLDSGKLNFWISYRDYDLKQVLQKDTIDLKTLQEDSSGNPVKSSDFLQQVGFNAVMLPTGKIESVRDTGDLLRNIDEGLQAMEKMNRDRIMTAIRPIVNNDMVKGMMEQCFFVFPAEKVNVGDSWRNEIVLQTMFSMIIKSTYTLEAIKNDIATIKVKADIRPGNAQVQMPGLAMTAPKGTTPNPDKKGFDLMGVNLKASFEGSEEGWVWVNMKTGMVTKNELEQHLDGKFSVGILDLPMTMDMMTAYEVKPLN